MSCGQWDGGSRTRTEESTHPWGMWASPGRTNSVPEKPELSALPEKWSEETKHHHLQPRKLSDSGGRMGTIPLLCRLIQGKVWPRALVSTLLLGRVP
jgi:hypothetical protein